MPAPVSAAVEGRLELAEGAVRPEDGRGGDEAQVCFVFIECYMG